MFKGEASTPPAGQVYFFFFLVKIVPIKANLAALYAFNELIKGNACLF